MEEDLPIRRQTSLWSRENYRYPVYARTDMFDYQANNVVMHDCIRAPLDKSYGMRTDHHAFLNSAIMTRLYKSELKETGISA
jgi:hypothetical protein